MLNLLKYELRKTMASKILLVVALVLLQATFMIGYYTGKSKIAIIGLIALAFIAIFGVLIAAIASISCLHRDMNTKQAYMLFMTPHSDFAILGAKVIECVCTILLTGLVCFFLLRLDINMTVAKWASEGTETNEVLDAVMGAMKDTGLGIDLSLASIAQFVFSMVTSIILLTLTGFLADVLSTSVLKGKKGCGLLSLVIFIVIDVILEEICSIAAPDDRIILGMESVWTKGIVRTVLAALLYFVTAKIMEKKLSV